MSDQTQVNLDALIEEVDNLNNKMFELQKTIAPELQDLTDKRNKAKEILDRHIMAQAMKELAANDYGCGTANIETALHKIKTVVSKNVKWDEDVLRQIANQIRTSGQDPEAYIKYKLSVSETAFKNFPEAIQNAFIPARSVEPSAPKITVERKS